MPSFTNTLIGAGPIYDANCTVVFNKKDVTVLSPEDKPILQGWTEKKLPRLWRFALKPTDRSIKDYTTTNQKSPKGAQCLRPAKHRIPSPLHEYVSRISS